MDKSEQDINNNVNENTALEVCEVPVNGLDNVSITDLREELGLVVEPVSDDVKSASVAGENDENYTQIDVAVEKSEVDVSAPSQEGRCISLPGHMLTTKQPPINLLLFAS